MCTEFSVKTLSDWDEWVPRIASRLFPGAILALSGPLGAGKTTFTQKLAAHLGVKETVKSPTFALMRTHIFECPTLRRLVHVDAYRLEKEADLQALNLEEELEEPGTIAVIEWPENIPHWLTERAERVIWLMIEPKDEEERIVRWEMVGEEAASN